MRAASGAALAAAFFAVFFFLCFLVACFLAGCAACADDSLEDGAGAVSTAQAGITIRANKSSNMFFMVAFLVVDEGIAGYSVA
jgi:hypothetical protein